MPDPTTPREDNTEKIKTRYTLALACTATAVITYAIAGPLKSRSLLETIKAQRRCYNEIEFENWILTDFLDAKKLKNEYFEFAKTHEFNT